MSTDTVQIYVETTITEAASITLWHKRGKQMQSKVWELVLGGSKTNSPLEISFDPNDGNVDAWAVKLTMLNGVGGVYQSGGGDNWTTCPLTSDVAGKAITFSVDASTLTMPIPPKGVTSQMRQVAPSQRFNIDNVFVLMLENHSFDNIFAFSGIKGIQAATTSDTNSFGGHPYPVYSTAPWAMPTDPGHEFLDVLTQLCGPPSSKPPPQSWTSYQQPITNGGFVDSYATTTSEAPWWDPHEKPSSTERGEIMACFDTLTQLPVIHALASNFAICDAWHSSLPGPTWPNRFFVHGASSAGWTASPGIHNIIGWNYVDGFTYPSGASIYDKLNQKAMGWRVYQDEQGAKSGAVPQVLSLKGVGNDDIHDFKTFAQDVQGPYPYAYTFIEPNYGDTALETYKDGSSQHPMDSVQNGEALIKATYEAIRNSPLWASSLLIITYDEHGGFYDSVAPQAAPPPNDGSGAGTSSINETGFPFNLFGVRVPAVIVSPQIAAATVDHTPYDHASVSATLHAIFATGTMTARDAAANSVTSLLTVYPPRTDCPKTLPQVAEPSSTDALAAAPIDEAVLAAQPLPEEGNAIGTLLLLAKRDAHLSGDDAAAAEAVKARVAAIKTRGDLAAYAEEVQAKLLAARAARSAAAIEDLETPEVEPVY